MRTIGYTIPSLANPAGIPLVNGLASTAAARDARLLVTDPELDLERQVADIDRLLSIGVDALLVYPTGDPQALYGAFDRAAAAGVPLFTHDDTGHKAVIGELVTPVDEMGALAADILAEMLGGAGTVAVIGGVEAPAIVERVEGFRDRLASAHPGMSVIATVANLIDNSEGAEAVVADLLAEGLVPDGVFGYNDASAIGAAGAASAAGVSAVIVGNNGDPVGVAAVADGTIAGTVDRLVVELGQRGADLILDVLDGIAEPGSPRRVAIEPAAVTGANVDAFVPWDVRCPEPPAGSWEIV